MKPQAGVLGLALEPCTVSHPAICEIGKGNCSGPKGISVELSFRNKPDTSMQVNKYASNFKIVKNEDQVYRICPAHLYSHVTRFELLHGSSSDTENTIRLHWSSFFSLICDSQQSNPLLY